MNLGFPKSSQIKGARYPLRELRLKSKGKQIRVLYIFDAERNALLLLGGWKTEGKRFYAQMVPQAEKLWESHLEQLKRDQRR